MKKITNKQINKFLPSKPKQEAIKESERYRKEYEQSRQQLEDIISDLERLKKELLELEDSDSIK